LRLAYYIFTGKKNTWLTASARPFNYRCSEEDDWNCTFH